MESNTEFLMLLELGAKIKALPLAFTTLTESLWDHSFTLKCLTLISAISKFYMNLIWAKFCTLLDPKVKEWSSSFVFL